MKKFYLLLVVSVWSATVQAAKGATKPLSTKKTPARTGSTTGSSAVNMTSSQGSGSSSLGGLNVTGGGISSSSISGSSSSNGPTVANSYQVIPADNPPPFSYNGNSNEDYMLPYMQKMCAQGYTTLEGLSDKGIEKLKAGNIGNYNSKGQFTPALKQGGLSGPGKKWASALTNGVYKINQNVLRQSIKEGVWSAQLLTNRLLVQEFFLGRLAVTMQAMANGTALGSGQTDFKKISDAVGVSLKQTRYIRNGVEATVGDNRSVISVSQSKTFTPVDFFVGAIVVNKTTAGIQFGDSVVIGGGVGFLPVPKTAYMNNWSNAAGSSRTGLPTRKPMTLGQVGVTGGGEIELTPTPDNKTMTIGFNTKTYTPESFGQTTQMVQQNGRMVKQTLLTQQKFFEDFSPWAIIIEVPSKGAAPFVVGLAKMSPGDYGKYLNIDGKVASVTGAFTLGDVINAPYNLYRKTYEKSTTGSGKRFVSGNSYPISDWVAQGMFNGQLELSQHKVLACNKKIPAVYKTVKDTNVSQRNQGIDWRKVIKTPATFEYPPFKSEAVSIIDKHAPGPEAVQILAKNSGIDWLFLRALRITKAVLTLSGITEKLLAAIDSNGNHIFLQVLQSPQTDRVAQSNGQFSQSAGSAGTATQVSGAAMLSNFGNSGGTVSKEVVKHKKSKKGKKAKSPILKGDVLYIGKTENYLPLILTTDYAENSNTQQHGAQSYLQTSNNLSGLSSTQAYRKGYRKGQQVAKGSHNSNVSRSSRAYDATFHKLNARRILPTSQAGRATRRRSSLQKRNGGTVQNLNSNNLVSGRRNFRNKSSSYKSNGRNRNLNSNV